MDKTIASVKQPQPPIEREILATAIVKISDSVTALSKSGVNREAIEILLQADTKLSRRDIRLVLDSVADLRRRYTK